VIAALVGALTVALLAGTGLTVASSLALRGWTRLVLGAYVVAFAEVVLLTLLLSAFGAVTRTALLAGLAVLLVAALAVWILLGAPALPPLPVGRIRALPAVPVLLVLVAVVGLAFAYVVALVVGTPPNTWDSLTYHLARAALWRQAGGVGDIQSSYDERLDVYPPNAEIALTFVLEVTREERLAGFVQLAAALVTATGIFALARKLGLARSEAAIGALLFLTLPIVLLQSSTTQNDLVAASLLVAATVFVLGSSRRELALAGLATALAVGTKIPAAFGLPILAAIALAAPPRPARVARVVALVAGGAAGSYWYVVNLVRTGHPLGDTPDPTGLVALLEPKRNLVAAYARVLDAFDLSGAEGADLYLYVVAAAVAAAAVLLVSRAWLGALATGALAALPLAFIPVSYALWRPFAKLHDVLEEPVDGILPVAGWERQDSASETYSWFGPLGLLLVVGMGAVAWVLFRRRSLPALALVFASAPLVLLVLLSVSVGYDPWQGRFFIFPVALSAALWGLVLRVRVVAVAAVAIAATTATLTLVHFIEKPSGLRLLAGNAPASIWSMERWQAQSVLRAEMTPVLELVEERIPHDATVALALHEDDFAYPAFGPHLERRVELVPGEGAAGSGIAAEWLVASPEHAREVDSSCWLVELDTDDGWRVFRSAASSEESC
jgi:hypothetical protein